MKKVVVGVLLLGLVAAVGVPFVNGLVMEKIVKKSFTNLNTMYADTGSGVSIEIVRYDRNPTSTEIEWRIRLGAMKAIYGVEEILFIDRAKHGYTGIVSTTSLEKNQWFTDFIRNQLAGKNPLLIATEYKLSGKIHSTITLEPFSWAVDEQRVAVKPGTAVFTWNESLKNFSSETSWQGFSIADNIDFDGIFIRSNLEKISTYLWDGNLSYGVEKGQVTQIHGSGDQLMLAGFKGGYSLDIDKEENTVSVVATFAVDRLQAGLAQLDNGFVRLGLINMDARGFEEFIKLYNEMASTVLHNFAVAGDDPVIMKKILRQQMGHTQFQVLTAYERLLKKGLELQLSDLHVEVPEGEIAGDVAISLDKDMTLAQLVSLWQQPELILDVITLRSEFLLPAALTGENSMLSAPIHPGMQTGLFIKEGDNLTHKAQTRDGKLYLNGQELQFH